MAGKMMEYVESYYEEKSNKIEKNYDYLWCGADAPMHKHVDFYELFFVAGGSCNHFYKGQTEQLQKKHVYFFKPGESHQIMSNLTRCFHFTFLAKKDFFENFFERYPIFVNLFGNEKHVSCMLGDVEFNYIYKLTNMLTHQKDDQEIVVLFLYNILYLLQMNKNEKNTHRGTIGFVIDIAEKINNYTFLTCKVSDIYKMYPIAQSTLIKEFKNYTGKTIVQYQREQKMTFAANLLISPFHSITEISEQLCYDSFSHFLHTFKEYYGVTPKEYRKRHMRAIELPYDNED